MENDAKDANTDLKVCLVTRGGILPYDPAKHQEEAENFIYWETPDGKKALLIVSQAHDGMNHPELKSAFEASLRHNDRLECGWASSKLPKGAGVCGSGQVKSWESRKLRLTTHEKFRPIIQKALGM